MMKRGLLLFCMITLFGCAYGQNLLDDPRSFIKDPHFAKYQENMDYLEIRYLHKDITYAEYVEERNMLDETYAREVKERNDKIMSPE